MMPNVVNALFLLIISASIGSCGDNGDRPSTQPPQIKDADEQQQADNQARQNKVPETSLDSQQGIGTDVSTQPPSVGDVVPTGFTSWEDLATVDPERQSLLAFDGTDPLAELLGEPADCTLYVMAKRLQADGTFHLVMRTSFSHGDDSHPPIEIPEAALAETAVTAVNELADITLFLALAEPMALETVTRFNLKWFHINHYDTGTCERLALRANNSD
jgi:predicted small lipoprotein YifL